MTAPLDRAPGRFHHRGVKSAGAGGWLRHLTSIFIHHQAIRMLVDDVFLQLLLIGIDHLPMRFFPHGIVRSEYDIYEIELLFDGCFRGEKARKRRMSCSFHRRTSITDINYEVIVGKRFLVLSCLYAIVLFQIHIHAI